MQKPNLLIHYTKGTALYKIQHMIVHSFILLLVNESSLTFCLLKTAYPKARLYTKIWPFSLSTFPSQYFILSLTRTFYILEIEFPPSTERYSAYLKTLSLQNKQMPSRTVKLVILNIVICFFQFFARRYQIKDSPDSPHG